MTPGGFKPPKSKKGRKQTRPKFSNGYGTEWITNGQEDRVVRIGEQ